MGHFLHPHLRSRLQWLVWHPQKQCRWMDVGKNSLSIGRSTYQNRIMYHWTFCGKTDGGTIIFILTVAYPTLCPFSPKSAVLKRRSFCSILLSYDAREENICAYTQQNWRGKVEPCTKMSKHFGRNEKEFASAAGILYVCRKLWELHKSKIHIRLLQWNFYE